MNARLIPLCLLLSGGCLHAQSYTWGFGLGGSGMDHGKAVALDGLGHLDVATVLLHDSVDMDPGPVADSLYSGQSTLAQYDVNGTYGWSFSFGTGGFMEAHLTTDVVGNVVIAGDWTGWGDLDPGPGVVDPYVNGPGNMMVAKYDVAGNHLWSFNIGTSSTSHIGAVSLDGAGNVYISGRASAGCDYDPGPGVNVPFSYGGGEHDFLAKYDPNGYLLWALTLDGPVYSTPTVAVDPQGNAYLSGYVGDTLNMDPGLGDHLIGQVDPLEDVFIARYGPDGSFHWGGCMGGTLDGYNHGIATNAQGRVALCGTFRGTYDFDISAATYNLSATVAGAYDAFVVEYDSLGIFQWARRFGSTGYDQSKAIAMADSGEVTITGTFSSTISFGGPFINSHGWEDVFAAELDASGNVLWGFGIGGSDYDDVGGVAMADDGSTYLTGDFAAEIDLDPGSGTALFNHIGQYDAFVARYDGISTAVPMGSATSDLPLVAPNPAQDRLDVRVSEAGDFVLLNGSGQAVARGHLFAGTNQLDLSSFAPGIYLLRIATEASVHVLPVVKE